jgi:hypothetical protein
MKACDSLLVKSDHLKVSDPHQNMIIPVPVEGEAKTGDHTNLLTSFGLISKFQRYSIGRKSLVEFELQVSIVW